MAQMLITVDEGRSLGLVFGSLFPVEVEGQSARTVRDDKGNATPKLSKDGKSYTYRVPLTAFRLDEKGNPIGADDSVTLAVRKPVAIKAGVHYELTGKTYVVHYVNDRNRLAVSIEAESVAPKKATD